MAAQTTRVGRREAYDFLRSRIIRLELPPGTAVSENEVGATLGVSRTPVREALLLLAQERLVEVIPQVGTFVSRVDPRRVHEAQFLREAVELASLRSLRSPLDPVVLAALQSNLDAQEHVTDSLGTFFELDEDFHRGLMALADHEASWETVVAAKGHLDRARLLGYKQQASTRRFVDEHRAILDALVAGNLEGAQDLLRNHVRVIFEDIQSVERTSPELFVSDPNARPVRKSVIVWETPTSPSSAPPQVGTRPKELHEHH
ncbi:MAG: GntR family transcriptional regulator [Georgenia sp.]